MSSSPKTVVVVDDAPENLAFIRACLSGAGYAVFAAKSGEECLALLTRIRPRVILLDVQMPGLDGFETCRRIRTRPELAAVPIAFLTTRGAVWDVQEGMVAGGNDFITKPVARQKLLDRVQYWATHRPRLRAVAPPCAGVRSSVLRGDPEDRTATRCSRPPVLETLRGSAPRLFDA
jgi:CheY-like chemotaxis protein